nr:isoform 2 of death-associated protein kinase 1 [Quercus suber]
MDLSERRRIQNRNAQRRFRNKSSTKTQVNNLRLPGGDRSISEAASSGGPKLRPRVPERTLINAPRPPWSSPPPDTDTRDYQAQDQPAGQHGATITDEYQDISQTQRNSEAQILQDLPTTTIASHSFPMPESLTTTNYLGSSSAPNDMNLVSLPQTSVLADHFDIESATFLDQSDEFMNETQWFQGLGEENHSFWTDNSAPDAAIHDASSNLFVSRSSTDAAGSTAVSGNISKAPYTALQVVARSSELSGSPSSKRLPTQNFGCKAAHAVEDVDNSSAAKDGAFAQSALHIAAEHGYETLVQMLLASGFNVDERDSDNNTALHCAVYNCHSNLAKCLLQQGADPNAKNDNGWTPVHFAFLTGSTDAVNSLVSYGGDLTIKARGRQYCRSGKVFEPL